MRPQATVVGLRPSPAILMNRNDQPQIRARRRRRRIRRTVNQPGARTPPPNIEPMSKSLVERRLRQVASRLQQLREELEVSGEQLDHLADAADDARLRALVSETPVADVDHRQAERHAEAMRRHRAAVLDEITKLERDQDELLDRLVTESGPRSR